MLVLPPVFLFEFLAKLLEHVANKSLLVFMIELLAY